MADQFQMAISSSAWYADFTWPCDSLPLVLITCTNNKIHIKFLCIEGKIHSDMDKTWRANVSILYNYVTQISIFCTCVNMRQLETN